MSELIENKFILGDNNIIVAIDYFTKWAEAMPMFNYKANTMA